MRRACIVVVVALAGCGPGSYGDLRNGLVGSMCSWAQKCGYVDRTDRADCPLDDVLTIFGDSSAERALPGAIDVEGSISEGRMRYDSVNAGNCEDAVKGAPCDPVLAARKRLQSCNAVVAANTATGKLCYADAECTGGICVHEAGCAGVCVAYAPFGTPCDPNANSDGVAPIESRCDPTVGFCGPPSPGAAAICQHKKPSGSGCSLTIECDFGWDCRGGKCVTPIQLDVGQACGGEDPCKHGAYCDATTMTCAAQGKLAAPCTDPLGCKDGMACQGLTITNGPGGQRIAAGLCQPWLKIGAPCTGGADVVVTGCPSLSSACTQGVCTPLTHATAPGARCDGQSCGVGLGCDANGACDFLVGVLGGCGGARSNLCEPGLACQSGGVDRERCTVPSPPACFTLPDLDMLDVDMLESSAD